MFRPILQRHKNRPRNDSGVEVVIVVKIVFTNMWFNVNIRHVDSVTN
jgi:hypothetical protein